MPKDSFFGHGSDGLVVEFFQSFVEGNKSPSLQQRASERFKQVRNNLGKVVFRRHGKDNRSVQEKEQK